MRMILYIPDESKIDTFSSMRQEYVPSGTNIGECLKDTPIIDDDIIMTSYNKAYNNVWVSCENKSEEFTTIVLPLLYYRG